MLAPVDTAGSTIGKLIVTEYREGGGQFGLLLIMFAMEGIPELRHLLLRITFPFFVWRH